MALAILFQTLSYMLNFSDKGYQMESMLKNITFRCCIQEKGRRQKKRMTHSSRGTNIRSNPTNTITPIDLIRSPKIESRTMPL